VRGEDYGLSETGDNCTALQAAIDAARVSSRVLTLPPGTFATSCTLNASGVDIHGTQGHLGTRITLTNNGDVDLFLFSGQYASAQNTRGGLYDLILYSDVGVRGKRAIAIEGDATWQPDHIRIERVRVTGPSGTDGWKVCLGVNGLARNAGALGNRGLRVDELLCFNAHTNAVVLRGLYSAVLTAVHIYTGFGTTAASGFYVSGTASVPNGDIQILGSMSEGPLYIDYTGIGYFQGRFGAVSQGSGNSNITVHDSTP
jgi:hypothetical protein